MDKRKKERKEEVRNPDWCTFNHLYSRDLSFFLVLFRLFEFLEVQKMWTSFYLLIHFYFIYLSLLSLSLSACQRLFLSSMSVRLSSACLPSHMITTAAVINTATRRHKNPLRCHMNCLPLGRKTPLAVKLSCRV